MIPIPLGTRHYKNKSLPVSAQILVNLYPEFLDQDAKNKVILHQMPGLSSFCSITTGPIRGMCKHSNVLYVVSGSTLYSVNSSGTESSIGTIPGSGNVSMASNGDQLIIVNGTSTGYVYTSSLATTTLTGPASTVDYLQGYFIFVNDDTGSWFISDFGDGTTYDSTETGSTNTKADNNIAIVEYQSRVVVFGEDTVSFWRNVGTGDLPFQRINEAVVSVGIANKNAFTEANDTLIFLGSDGEVYQLTGLQPRRISDPSLSYAIKDLSNAEMFSFTWQSHVFAVLSFDTKTYVFDVTTGLWFEWGYLSNGSFIKHKAHNAIYIYGKTLVGDHTDGEIYELSDTTKTDNGNPIRWEFITPPIHNADDYLFFGDVFIDFETGTALSTGQGSKPVCDLSYSGDGKVFSSKRFQSIGLTGEYKDQVRFHRNGSDKMRVWKVGWSDPIKTSVMGIYIDATG
jgi:hypothetical protein